jgi:hypothetical protein
MPFLEPFVRYGRWVRYDAGPDGECLVPAEDYEASFGRKVEEHGPCWGGHLSAPGYMDQTPWKLFLDATDETSARKALAADEDVCATCFEQCWEGEDPCPDLCDVPTCAETAVWFASRRVGYGTVPWLSRCDAHQTTGEGAEVPAEKWERPGS